MQRARKVRRPKGTCFGQEVNSANMKTAEVAFCAQWCSRNAKSCNVHSLYNAHICNDSQKTLHKRLSPTEDVDYYYHFVSESTDIQLEQTTNNLS